MHVCTFVKERGRLEAELVGLQTPGEPRGVPRVCAHSAAWINNRGNLGADIARRCGE